MVIYTGMLSRYAFEFEEKDSNLYGYYANNAQKILVGPYYYTLNGTVNSTVRLMVAGLEGEVLGSFAASPSSNIYDFRFNNQYIFATNTAWRLHGFSLCYDEL